MPSNTLILRRSSDMVFFQDFINEIKTFKLVLKYPDINKVLGKNFDFDDIKYSSYLLN